LSRKKNLNNIKITIVKKKKDTRLNISGSKTDFKPELNDFGFEIPTI